MSGRKRLSCKRCQTRKIRCNRFQPCSNCAQVDALCEYRDVDVRRRPVSQTYLAALESRLAWYESSLRTLKRSSSSDRDALLREISFDDHLGEPTAASRARPAPDAADNEMSPGHAVALRPGPSGE
jgi:hypothetical protein